MRAASRNNERDFNNDEHRCSNNNNNNNNDNNNHSNIDNSKSNYNDNYNNDNMSTGGAGRLPAGGCRSAAHPSRGSRLDSIYIYIYIYMGRGSLGGSSDVTVPERSALVLKRIWLLSEGKKPR